MRIFVLLSRVPFPLEKGDKLRAYHQLKELSKSHQLILCCLSDTEPHPDAINELSQWSERIEIIRLTILGRLFNLALSLFSNKPFQVHYFMQGHARRKIKKLIADCKPDHIYCQLVRTAEYVKNHFEIPKTIDYQDAFSKGVERRIAGATWWFKPILRAETKRLLAYENLVFEYFDNKTIISKQDRELIYHPNRKSIAIVPNGVDTEYFVPMNTSKVFDIVFTGNMNYPPNISGAAYLAQHIFPLVLKKLPEAKLLISGVNPSKKVQALASNNITVSGWVEDIRTSYSNSKVFVAPMQIGTGLQNKILEAMAMEIPCITSQLANSALNATPGKAILIGNTPEEYANQIVNLINDNAWAEKVGKAGRSFVIENYNWQTTTNILSALIQGN